MSTIVAANFWESCVRLFRSRDRVVDWDIVPITLFAVYGALLGTQDGRHVVISNSYELVFESAQKVTIDVSYLEKRLDCGMVNK